VGGPLLKRAAHLIREVVASIDRDDPAYLVVQASLDYRNADPDPDPRHAGRQASPQVKELPSLRKLDAESLSLCLPLTLIGRSPPFNTYCPLRGIAPLRDSPRVHTRHATRPNLTVRLLLRRIK
jgi:hypothetical protein